MQTSSSAFDNPLEAAASELRTLCRNPGALPPPFDAGTVGRILVHITNINRSVVASTQDHVNAAKRLNDFALIFTRLGRASAPPNGELAARLSSVADNLRAASGELAGADAIPNWRSPKAEILTESEQ